MGMRVRGKATARPNEVGDPSLRVRDGVCRGPEFPDEKTEMHLACQTWQAMCGPRCFGPDRRPNIGSNYGFAGISRDRPLSVRGAANPPDGRRRLRRPR